MFSPTLVSWLNCWNSLLVFFFPLTLLMLLQRNKHFAYLFVAFQGQSLPWFLVPMPVTCLLWSANCFYIKQLFFIYILNFLIGHHPYCRHFVSKHMHFIEAILLSCSWQDNHPLVHKGWRSLILLTQPILPEYLSLKIDTDTLIGKKATKAML